MALALRAFCLVAQLGAVSAGRPTLGRMAQNRKRLRVGDADRDAVVEVLQQAYSHGRLTMEEYSTRQDAALEARFAEDLRELIEDLPEQDALPTTAVVRSATGAQVPQVSGSVPISSAAVLSGKTVQLEPGRTEMNSIAFMGGDDIYVRDALGPGVTVTLTLNAVMGGNNVYVPPGVRVVDESVAIMAGNDVKTKAQGDGSQGTVVLRGFLFWGGNDVKLDKRDRR